MITVNTTRFGTLQVEDQRVIHFPDGILGFPELKHYILLDYKDTSLKWLQSVESPEIAFIVTPPQNFLNEFDIEIDDMTRKSLKLENDDDLAVLLILRVENEEVIANLNGPLAINSKMMMGLQTVSDRKN